MTGADAESRELDEIIKGNIEGRTDSSKQKRAPRDVEFVHLKRDDCSLLTASTSSLSDNDEHHKEWSHQNEANESTGGMNETIHGPLNNSLLRSKQRRRNNHPRAHRTTRSFRTREKYSRNIDEGSKEQPIQSVAAKRRASLGSAQPAEDLLPDERATQRRGSLGSVILPPSTKDCGKGTFQRRTSLGNNPSAAPMKELVPGGRSGAAQRRGSFGKNPSFDPPKKVSSTTNVDEPVGHGEPAALANTEMNRSQSSHDWSLGYDYEHSQGSISSDDDESVRSEQLQNTRRSNVAAFENRSAHFRLGSIEVRENASVPRNQKMESKIIESDMRRPSTTNDILLDSADAWDERQKTKKEKCKGDREEKRPFRRSNSNSSLAKSDSEVREGSRRSRSKKGAGGNIRKSSSTNDILDGIDDTSDEELNQKKRSDENRAPRRSGSSQRLSDTDLNERDGSRRNRSKKGSGGNIRKSSSTNDLLDDIDDTSEGDLNTKTNRSGSLAKSDRDGSRQSRSKKGSGGNIRKSSSTNDLLDDIDDTSEGDLNTKTNRSGSLAKSDRDGSRRSRSKKGSGGNIRKSSSTNDLLDDIDDTSEGDLNTKTNRSGSLAKSDSEVQDVSRQSRSKKGSGGNIRKSSSTNDLLDDIDDTSDEELNQKKHSDENRAPRRSGNSQRLSDTDLNERDGSRRNRSKNGSGGNIRKSSSTNDLLDDTWDDDDSNEKISRKSDSGEMRAPRRSNINPSLAESDSKVREGSKRNRSKKDSGGTIRKSSSTNDLLDDIDDNWEGGMNEKKSREAVSGEKYSKPWLSDTDIHEREGSKRNRSKKNSGGNIRKSSSTNDLLDDIDTWDEQLNQKKPSDENRAPRRNDNNQKLSDTDFNECEGSRRNKKDSGGIIRKCSSTNDLLDDIDDTSHKEVNAKKVCKGDSDEKRASRRSNSKPRISDTDFNEHDDSRRRRSKKNSGGHIRKSSSTNDLLDDHDDMRDNKKKTLDDDSKEKSTRRRIQSISRLAESNGNEGDDSRQNSISKRGDSRVIKLNEGGAGAKNENGTSKRRSTKNTSDDDSKEKPVPRRSQINPQLSDTEAKTAIDNQFSTKGSGGYTRKASNTNLSDFFTRDNRVDQHDDESC